MSQIINEFEVTSKLSENSKRNIKLFYIFQNSNSKNSRSKNSKSKKSESKYLKWSGYNVLIIAKNDQVFGFGDNSLGQLGLGHDEPVKEPTIIQELCSNKLVEFSNGVTHCIARTQDGRVYEWGKNDVGQLSFEKKDFHFHKPHLIRDFKKIKIIQICCGYNHTIALSDSGKVYGWGRNEWGQLGFRSRHNYSRPIKVSDLGQVNVEKISCGSWHSMALRKDGHIFSWGLNSSGQLGTSDINDRKKPEKIIILDKNDAKIVSFQSICCGPEHSLLLSKNGYIYGFGKNTSSQLEVNDVSNFNIPVKIQSESKFIDIASHHFLNISIVLSIDGFYHVWGDYEKSTSENSELPGFESFIDVLQKCFYISYKTIDPEKYDLVPKRKIGKYFEEFDEKGLISGNGSFGVVFKCVNKSDSKFYAVKKIALEQSEVELAFRELSVMKSLRSGYVVEYIESWIENNYYTDEKYKKQITEVNYKHRIFDPKKPFLLHIQMEFCLSNLSDFIENLKSFEEFSAITMYFFLMNICIEIVECVDFLHKKNPPIIHRDLKPDNILITDEKSLREEEKGRFIRLADFGLAVKHEFENQSHTQDKGTPKYMAQEVVYGRKYDTKADIYSLGMIFQKLFYIDNENSIYGEDFNLIADKYIGLKALIDRMTASDQTLRPDCDEILAALHMLSLNLEDMENDIAFQQMIDDDELDLLDILRFWIEHFIKQKYAEQKQSFVEHEEEESWTSEEISNNGSITDNSSSSELIKVTVLSQDNNETNFRLKPDTQFWQLKKTYGERLGIQSNSLRFLLDGKHINDNDTPNTLMIEDYDLIEVYYEQIGGYVIKY